MCSDVWRQGSEATSSQSKSNKEVDLRPCRLNHGEGVSQTMTHGGSYMVQSHLRLLGLDCPIVASQDLSHSHVVYAYLSCCVSLCLAACHSLHLMHGVVLVCCFVVWLIDWMCMCYAMVMSPLCWRMTHWHILNWSAHIVLHIPWQTCTISIQTNSCYPLWHHSQ